MEYTDSRTECVGYLFSILCLGRGPFQLDDEAHSTFHLDPDYYGGLGVCSAPIIFPVLLQLIYVIRLVCTMMGLVKNYQGLMVARVFLGLAEGG